MSGEREPCPACGEPAALSLRACPACGESLLLDVVLQEPVAEPRARYGLAREISACGPPALPFATLQRTLSEPRPTVARDAVRLAAQRLRDRLAGLGLAASLEPAAGEPPRPVSRRGLAAAVLGFVVLLASLLALLFGRHAAPPPAPHRPTRAVLPASAPSWDRPLSQPELAALALPAVVRFRTADGRQALGSLVAPGLALTRAAAVGDGRGLKVLAADGGESDGEIAQRDDRIGMALVRVSAPGTPLRLGDAAALHGGQQVFFAIPTDGQPLLQDGLLGAGFRKLQGIVHLAFESGPPSASDGGPVLDARGSLVGLVAMQPDGPYLIPINYAYVGSQLVDPPRPAPDPRKWRDLLAELDAVERLRVGTQP